MVNKFEERRQWAEKITKAIDSGKIEEASRTTLTEYSTWLCSPLAQGEFGPDGRYEEVCEVVRLHMLRTMMDAFEKRTKVMQNWVLFFAVFAIVATLMPYLIAPNPIFEATPSPKESASKMAQDSAPLQPPVTASPSQSQRPSIGQGVKQGTGQAKKENP